MSKHTNRIPPALKHGIYSGIGLLPTEDPAEFQKCKQEIFDDLAPIGRLEKGTAEHIACLLWRRQNLFTYRLAMRARDRYDSIYSELKTRSLLQRPSLDNQLRPEELEYLHNTAEKQARSELGEAFELVAIGDVATIEQLDKELAVIERLDGMIDRAFKSFLHVRGIKSMLSSATAPSQRLLGKAA